MGFQEYIAFTILVPCILSMWPSQLSLYARMKLITFLRFIISSSSWLVFMRHIPFSLFGQNIFLKIFLSITNSLLIMDLNTQLTKFLSGGNSINYTDFGSLKQCLSPARQGKYRHLAARFAFDKQVAFLSMSSSLTCTPCSR
jgi:hypothetical protein